MKDSRQRIKRAKPAHERQGTETAYLLDFT
jgi:hypothetical protein